MVPKAALDDARKQARTFRDENIYLKGALKARETMPAAVPAVVPQPAATPQQTVQDLIRAQAQRILDASKTFDEGELTMVQFKEIEFQANDIIADLRARHLLNHIQSNLPVPQPERVGLADGERLDQHVEEMAAAYPWSAVLTDQELSMLAGMARADASRLGQPFTEGPAETMRLRQAIAELSEFYGPRWYPNGHPDLQVAAQPTPSTRVAPAQPNGGHQPPIRSGADAARRAIELASRQPPNTSQAGYGDTGTDQLPSEDRIDAMSEDEMLALPKAMRARLRDRAA